MRQRGLAPALVLMAMLAAMLGGAGCVGGAPAPGGEVLQGSAPVLAAARAAPGADAPWTAVAGAPAAMPASAASRAALAHSGRFAVRWLRPLAGRAEDDGVVADEGGRGGLRLVVTSSGGIGAAELRPERGVWPRAVQLQFQYAEGRPFDELEGLRVQVSAWAHQAGDEPAGAPPDGFVVWQREGALRVALPEGWLQQQDTLRIAWVDRYRR